MSRCSDKEGAAPFGAYQITQLSGGSYLLPVMPWDRADLEFESSAAAWAILVTSALPAAHTDETPTGEYLTSPPSLRVL